jgi:8-oxo-dGTP pyrophosphatase MutT (NUDIX family)
MLGQKIDPRMLAPQCNDLKPVETVHKNKWFSLMNRGGYFTLDYHLLQVVVLVVVDNHSIVMVRVKRPVIADDSLELPAGAVEADESPVDAAGRELCEETGICINGQKRFQLLSSIAISPNRYTVFPWIYLVNISENEFLKRGTHDHEIASVECFRFEEVKNKIMNGEIYVSLPLAVLGRFLLSNN